VPVKTVTGAKTVDELGIILPHEHLLLDLRNQFSEFDDPEKRRVSEQPVGADNLHVLRSNPYAIRDNLLLDDLELAIAEVGYFQRAGGTTIVDCTSIGIHRDPLRMRELSLRGGANIIAGSGYYTHDTHPAELERWSPAEIAELIIGDFIGGIDGTPIKPGSSAKSAPASRSTRASGKCCWRRPSPSRKPARRSTCIPTRGERPDSKLPSCCWNAG